MSLSKKINLREGERVIRIERKLFLVDWWQYCLGLAFLATAFFFMFSLFGFGWWGYALYGIMILIGLYILLRAWFFRYFNIFVITSERVVDLHRLGWFDLVVSSLSHKDVKDVAVRKKGIFSNLFNYGSLVVRSQSNQFVIEAAKIGNPQETLSLLQEVSEQYRQNRKLLDIKSIYRNFIKIIPELGDDELKTVNQLVVDQFEQDQEVEEESKQPEQADS
ncbi:MAG: hypothetical protein COU31_04670 [Candidatus Magasanikbacteria bacterium CG10_big_fil_rev_8_21_14_0_10_40_10]|uniref:DUF304 domain-containing protein n=1 Tax=Candidatus Magasanikbacteria bacterium CG10_big_fil_rev_8_21_14_0_10_40_10 TaxID=1974648 RepID=A0A2M6W2V3_9BACT|nr:MAG: hypothetical protein COU31_04670 [Candidatus Magasanikbacteria bacterium CG10_big_fil_rev_8_21_14_0_10_40_10]